VIRSTANESAYPATISWTSLKFVPNPRWIDGIAIVTMLKSTEARKTAHSMTARAGQRRAVMSEDWSVRLLDEIHIAEQRCGNRAHARGALRRHRPIQLAELLPHTPVKRGVLAATCVPTPV